MSNREEGVAALLALAIEGAFKKNRDTGTSGIECCIVSVLELAFISGIIDLGSTTIGGSGARENGL